MGQILVGTASWTDSTLIKCGCFYPDWAKDAESRLRYYASRFHLVEVDSSYYGMPTEDTSRLWVERTPPDFTFNVKAFRLLTQHQTPIMALTRDIREAVPLTGKTMLYQRDIPESILGVIWQSFEDALLPLDSAGKLGVVLFQFPPWFFTGDEQRNYILKCQERLPQYRIAVEFRHASWLNEKNRDRTLEFLWDNNLPLVCVDEPQGFKSSVPPVVEATSDIALVRFHGQNRETWEKKDIGPAERFNYLYSEEELVAWAAKIKALASKVSQVHVLFNNCYQDKAVANAARMVAMLPDLKE